MSKTKDLKPRPKPQQRRRTRCAECSEYKERLALSAEIQIHMYEQFVAVNLMLSAVCRSLEHANIQLQASRELYSASMNRNVELMKELNESMVAAQEYQMSFEEFKREKNKEIAALKQTILNVEKWAKEYGKMCDEMASDRWWKFWRSAKTHAQPSH
jgi:hypothetical protein